MALQAVWVPGTVAVPHTVGWSQLGHQVGGLAKARFDQSILPVTNPWRGDGIDWSDIVGHGGPGGVAYRGQSSRAVIFTFPIPTPCYRDNGTSLPPDPGRARLRRVFLLFQAASGVSLNQLFVYDSKRRIFTQRLEIRNGGGLPDDEITWGADPERSNTWEIGDPEVRFAISIAVYVQFGPDEANNQIVFRSAGADFIV
jgi:hypothetical protein